ncbi:MAG: hypothetical protein KY455_06465 [Euryarchaeota archaeon]|nr:hypothetical protein [Euryarchaeota archaeon]
MARGVCIRPFLSFAIVLLSAAQASSVVGLPTVQPPATVVDVGMLGVTDLVPYAAADGGLLVAPGSEVTLQASYGFSDAQGPSTGAQYNYVAYLRVHAATGQVGTEAVSHQATTSGAFNVTGVLELTLRVPEVARGLTIVLDTSVWRSEQGGGSLVGQATSSAPLTIVAVPEPVAFVTDDLVVADSFDGGTITATQAGRSVAATDGHTFVSTEIGTRFTALAAIDRPELGPATDIMFMVYATLNVNIEGGASYGQSRSIFMDNCNDWDTHACRFSAESRQAGLEVVVPPTALGPHSVVTVNLHLNYEHNEYDAMTGNWVGVFDMQGDSGRHVVVGV